MPTVSFDEINLYYERKGAGEPLLFISGTGGDLRREPNVFLGSLPKTFDVVAYDQRGLGRSSKPDLPYTMADYADDAIHLLDALGLDEVLVLGASFGGMVAQELVLRHPKRVKRLVLACTSPGGDGGSSYPFHDIKDLSGEARARLLTPVTDTRHDAAWMASHSDEMAMIIAAGEDPYIGEPGHKMGALRQLQARAQHDAWDRLRQIACPVMIAAGRYDGVALPASQEKMAARIPGAQLQFFEGGHLFMIQDRAALPAMVAFMRGERVSKA